MDEPIYTIPPDHIVHDTVFAAAPTNLWHLPTSIWEKIHQKVTGEGITVCVLDTGYTPHPDLPSPVAERSFISGQQVRDGNGHGTHCCGTAVGRNGLGVAPAARLMIGKVLSNQGSGGSGGIANGIEWATENGADVISMSLGGGGPDSRTNAAIDSAMSKGVIVNVAAGNSGFNGSANTIGWPGKHTTAVCTGAYRSDGSIASFSSGGEQIDWACPGQDIISCSTSGGYRSMSGTSMATPFGSGLWALIKELMLREGYPWWFGIKDVLDFLKTWGLDKGAAGHDPRWGWGIPKATEIVQALVHDDIKYV